MPKKILLIDDEEKLRSLLARIIQLEWEDIVVVQAGTLKSGFQLLKQSEIDVILCDVKLPDGNGVDAVLTIKQLAPEAEVILMTAYGQIADGVQAMKNGAFDYITKGDDNNKVLPLLHKAFEKVAMAKKLQRLEAQVGKKYAFDQVIGKSKGILEAIGLGRKVAMTDATVLLLGETGTGKEVFAQAIHFESPRKGQAFVALNCSAVSKDLLESELFGHVTGSFTGATRDKKGLFEEADKGTLFLDEIGEMPLELQAKLLRVLETGEFLKVGETKPKKVDVRIIAATNRNLEEEAAAGNFRSDLYYRLSVFTITLPSLNERPSDIPLLVDHFVGIHAQKLNRNIPQIAPSYVAALEKHAWKGNVRELKNIIERSLILMEGEVLDIDALPYEIGHPMPGSGKPAQLTLSAMELKHIQRVLAHTKGNKTEAAKLLGIGLATLYRKLEDDTNH
ncbi:sigma-54-dependent transcriptional regulator [Sphingobacterium lactis]|uniref:DNA-binding transcriptional response regulator, NtrC family, contains REC, AAA-type ATPase, and a Fis-type DNA-binding domains n=1 Tax=Sphingobacterium lactis TaxID=797291 RepID=A0A1H5ULR0_9SPHI|nr:sigma-54 dependent transcriptional regulator [Sphingobacterium lactis]SEF76019.1 DNA-binding transcriptional response regulator, NtrC family, contains REC, AAA-type ATPase, and a Fis-type DNA-binding domains [Sphingobacterium lactis]